MQTAEEADHNEVILTPNSVRTTGARRFSILKGPRLAIAGALNFVRAVHRFMINYASLRWEETGYRRKNLDMPAWFRRLATFQHANWSWVEMMLSGRLIERWRAMREEKIVSRAKQILDQRAVRANGADYSLN
jgi:hypothetical protein